MKKLFSANCLVFILSLSYFSPAVAVTIGFEPASKTASVGDFIDIDIVVSGLSVAGEIVSAYDLFVGYDATVLSATGVTFGNFLDDSLFLSTQFDDIGNAGLLEIGEVSFLFDDELSAIQPDSFVLATMSFNTLMAGSSDLFFEPHPFFGVNDIKGKNVEILTLDVDVGRIEVTAPPVSVIEPNSLILFLAGLVIIAFSSFRSSNRIGNEIVNL